MFKSERFALDHAGQVFSAITAVKRKPRFLFTAILTQDVDPKTLSRAYSETIHRFPYFNVTLKWGLFNHFLEESKKEELVIEGSPAQFLTSDERSPLLRVGYSGKRIIVEMAHCLSDGFGALAFLKILLICYFRILGVAVPVSDSALELDDAPRPEEYEDAYLWFEPKNLSTSIRGTNAYRPKGRTAGNQAITVTSSVLDVKNVLDIARRHKVSLTEYIAAVLIESLYLLQREQSRIRKHPIIISVSTDLRKYFPSSTLRNFSGYCNIGINPKFGNYSFDEMLSEVHHKGRLMLSEKYQRALICRNLALMHCLPVRILPLFLKRPIFSAVYKHLGTKSESMALTNMGMVDLPEEIGSRIEYLETIGGNFLLDKVSCGIISYRDKLSVCFSRNIDQPLIEDRFFEILSGRGLSVVRAQNINHMQPAACG